MISRGGGAMVKKANDFRCSSRRAARGLQTVYSRAGDDTCRLGGMRQALPSANNQSRGEPPLSYQLGRDGRSLLRGVAVLEAAGDPLLASLAGTGSSLATAKFVNASSKQKEHDAFLPRAAHGVRARPVCQVP